VGSESAEFFWNGKDETSFSRYLSASGEDAQSQFVNPLYRRIVAPLNLDVETTSPAVDAGSTLGALACSTTTGEAGAYWGCPLVGTEDFSGNPRDPGTTINIGAYEQ
jgi:hypothetical protein